MTRFLASGDTVLVVEFGDTVERALSARVLALAARIETAKLAGVTELVPTFRSLAIHYDPLRVSHAELREHVGTLLSGLDATPSAGRNWLLPACYEGDLAADLEEVAARTRLRTAEIVELHSGTTFHVYMLGFLPGFPYMGDLPEQLALPRREVPRIKVPMGSLAIAMRMAAIYPFESPGGWHLIARTPVRLFDRRRENAALLTPGDKVRFKPIPRAEYDRLEAQSAAGTLTIAPQRPSA